MLKFFLIRKSILQYIQIVINLSFRLLRTINGLKSSLQGNVLVSRVPEPVSNKICNPHPFLSERCDPAADPVNLRSNPKFEWIFDYLDKLTLPTCDAMVSQLLYFPASNLNKAFNPVHTI